VFFFRSSDDVQGKQDSVKFCIKDMLVAPGSRTDNVPRLWQRAAETVAQFRTISIDMIEIFKAITQFVKSDFKNLRRSVGFI